MRRSLKITIITATVAIGLPLVLTLTALAIGVSLYLNADFQQPDIYLDSSQYTLSCCTDSIRSCHSGSMILNRYGIWEASIQGNDVQRGATYGAICNNLLRNQETAFVNQLHNIIPNERYINLLHKLIIIFNRKMGKYIPEEYRREIYAMSLFTSHDYDKYGSPYIRQLNYHAAHDIGHAIPEYMLVGCSAFAVWDNYSSDSSLIIGRNFDFFVGDDFAKNKIILFVKPENGYKFASVSWPGMLGVVSGMNEKGLTVTLNAAKGPIPTSSAMPVSLLARHILQNAENINEAYEIAKHHTTFVSEAILIGSASDGYAAVIEKSTTNTSLFIPDSCRLILTNHYQSTLFENDTYNVSNIKNSDSQYRHNRINELIESLKPVSHNDAAHILRNRFGLNNADIGLSNEKSINQFIAHHSVIFKPQQLKMWVSTSPWQVGTYICYDLNKVFSTDSATHKSLVIANECLPPDSIMLYSDVKHLAEYRQISEYIRKATATHTAIDSSYINRLIKTNPHFYNTYSTIGDYMLSTGNTQQAITYWRKALKYEIPHKKQITELQNKINT